jgi:hypothetical protein
MLSEPSENNYPQQKGFQNQGGYQQQQPMYPQPNQGGYQQQPQYQQQQYQPQPQQHQGGYQPQPQYQPQVYQSYPVSSNENQDTLISLLVFAFFLIFNFLKLCYWIVHLFPSFVGEFEIY